MVVTCNAMADERWGQAVAESPDTWVHHLPDWLDHTADVLGLQNQYFVVDAGKQCRGGFPVQLQTTRVAGAVRRSAYGVRLDRAGPFCAGGEGDGARAKILRELCDAVIAWAKETDVEVIRCTLPPLAPSSLQNTRGVNPLVLAGWVDLSTHTRVTDLTQTESDLWSSLSYDARRSVKAARTAGYTVTQLEWGEALPEYYRVHMNTYRRTGAEPYPKGYFEGIARILAPRGRAVLWGASDPLGRLVAFHNSARYAGGSDYWTGCCETEHLASGVGYLLFWEALLGAKREGCTHYELGEVFPNARDGKLKGLSTFKSKFGGDIYRLYRAEVRLKEPPAWATAVRRARRLLRIG